MNLRLLYFVFIAFSFTYIPHAAGQGWEWAKSVGGTGNEDATTVTTDGAGNVYVAGSFSSASVTFGSYTLTNNNAGYTDIFLVKYDPNGNVIWANSVGGSSNDYATSVTLDAWGNIYVGGYFYSPTIVFGTTTLTNDSAGGTTCDIYIAKYNPSGNPIWAQRAGGTLNDQVYAAKADPAGNVIVTGSFESKYLVWGTDTVKNPLATTDDVFVIKYDSSGNFVWAAGTGDAGDNYGYAITTDASDNIFVAGKYNSSAISFGDTVLSGSGFFDEMFVVKYNAAGTVQWARSASGNNDAVANAIETDAHGNIYVAGDFADSALEFSTTSLVNAGGYDVFIAKYNTHGNVMWAKSNGGADDDYTYSLSLDDSSNVIISGNFASSTVTFGTTTITNSDAGMFDLFIAKYDSSGSTLWANTSGGANINSPNAVATDQAGNIYLTGTFSDSAFYFGTNLLLNDTHTGATDMFLAKYILTPLNTTNINAPAYTMALYPNPANDIINITLNGGGYNSISVYDYTGRIVYQNPLTGNEQMVKINTANLINGIYFVRAMHNETMETATFAIRK